MSSGHDVVGGAGDLALDAAGGDDGVALGGAP